MAWLPRGLSYRITKGATTVGPFEIGAHLPPDAVILGPHRARGPVIVSATTGRALKWVSRRPHLRGLFQAEISSLRVGATIEGEGKVPKLLAHGTYGSEADWMFMDFVPNPRPFISPQRYWFWRSVWIPWLSKHGFPFLWKFYRAANIEFVDVSAIWSDVRIELLKENVFRDLIARERDIVDRLSQKLMLRSTVHGDFSGHHVHRHEGGFTVIDWGESKTDFVFKDAVGLYWHNPSSRKPGAADFWRWLASEAQPVPETVSSFLACQAREIDFGVTPDEFRTQLRSIMAYEIASRRVSLLEGENVPDRLTEVDQKRLNALMGGDG